MKNATIDCVVLSGGLGTRLRSVVSDLPKSLAPIQGQSFLEHLFQKLAGFSRIRKVVLALGYKSEQIVGHCEAIQKSKPYPFKIEFSIETQALGTGGALAQAFQFCDSPQILAMNGDSFFEIDYEKFWQFHQYENASFSLVLQQVEDTSRYGRVVYDEASHHILAFEEKKPIHQAGWINAGVYGMSRDLFATYPQKTFSIESDFIPQYLQNHPIHGFLNFGNFIDIGTPESYQLAQNLFLAKDRP